MRVKEAASGVSEAVSMTLETGTRVEGGTEWFIVSRRGTQAQASLIGVGAVSPSLQDLCECVSSHSKQEQRERSDVTHG